MNPWSTGTGKRRGRTEREAEAAPRRQPREHTTRVRAGTRRAGTRRAGHASERGSGLPLLPRSQGGEATLQPLAARHPRLERSCSHANSVCRRSLQCHSAYSPGCGKRRRWRRCAAGSRAHTRVTAWQEAGAWTAGPRAGRVVRQLSPQRLHEAVRAEEHLVFQLLPGRGWPFLQRRIGRSGRRPRAPSHRRPRGLFASPTIPGAGSSPIMAR